MKNNLYCYYIMVNNKIKSRKASSKGKSTKKRQLKKTQKGGAYGATMNSMANNAKGNMGFGYSGPVKYNHCGGSKGIAIFNNRIGYGYTNEGAALSESVQGSYAPVSRYVASQCGAGKKSKKGKSKKGKSKKNKTLKSRKHLKGKSLKNKKSKKNKTVKGKKKYQKGGSGYTQFQSNAPVGASFESPNVTPPHNALGPLGINKTQVNCVDNYNHYKK